jgi:hypothetical protein
VADGIVVFVPMLPAYWNVVTDLLRALLLVVLFFINVLLAPQTLIIIMAHHPHRLIIRIIPSIHAIGLFLAIAFVVLLVIRVVSVILRFVLIVVGVLVAPSERKRAGSSRCLYDSFVCFAIEVCVVRDVPVDHGSKMKG